MTAPLQVAYLDRDGTINIDRHYLPSPDGFALCNGAGEGLADITAQGLDLVVITNQSGIARGYFDMDALEAIHARMADVLVPFGVRFAGVYACPHGPEDDCPCRKPRAGLIRNAEADLGARAGVMIGDKPSDIAAGRAAGLRCLLIGAAQDCDPAPDAIVPDLRAAADWIRAYNAKADRP